LRPRIYFDFSFDATQEMYAVIKNYGKRAACDVKIEIVPDFIHGMNESLNDAPYMKSLPFLSPENERRSALGPAPELFQKNKGSNEIEVSIRYIDEASKKKYDTSYKISLDSFRVRYVSDYEHKSL
jgi:hypothetical protein